MALSAPKTVVGHGLVPEVERSSLAQRTHGGVSAGPLLRAPQVAHRDTVVERLAHVSRDPRTLPVRASELGAECLEGRSTHSGDLDPELHASS